MVKLKNQTKTYTNPQKSFYTDLDPNQNNHFLWNNDLLKRKTTIGKFIINLSHQEQNSH